MSERTEMAYVARKACGCIVGATVDLPEIKRDVAKDVRRWIAAGYTVDRIPVDQVRFNFSCDHDKPPAPEAIQERLL